MSPRIFGWFRPDRDRRLQGTNLLDLAPVRVARWHEREDRVIIERPRPAGRGPGRLGRLVAYSLAPRQIRLDAIGTFAWRRLDGGPTVGEVAREVRREFGERAEPVEERLGEFVRLLRGERLLAYPGWDEAGRPEEGRTSPPRADEPASGG